MVGEWTYVGEDDVPIKRIVVKQSLNLENEAHFYEILGETGSTQFPKSYGPLRRDPFESGTPDRRPVQRIFLEAGVTPYGDLAHRIHQQRNKE